MNSPLSPTAHTIIGHQEVAINVWDYGGDGATLILCHCTGTCARVWDPVITQLTSHFRVLAPDARGHGDSDKPEEHDAYQWSNAGSDVCKIIEHFKPPTPIYAAGHSSGAAHVAYAQQQQPGIFDRLMLIDGIIAPPTAPLTKDSLSQTAKRRRSTFKSKSDALDRFASKPPMNTWDPKCLQAYVDHGLAIQDDASAHLKCPPHIESMIYLHGGAPDVFQHIKELSQNSISLVTGQQSNVKPLVEMHHNQISDSSYFEIPNCSHFIPQEAPEIVAKTIIGQFM